MVGLAATSLAVGCGRQPKPDARGDQPEPTSTSCRFTLDQETFESQMCRFQFNVTGAKTKGEPVRARLELRNFVIAPETYPSLQLIAEVNASTPDTLADQKLAVKAIVLRSKDAGPLSSKNEVTVTFTGVEAPYLEGSFQGTVHASGSDKKIPLSGEFRAGGM